MRQLIFVKAGVVEWQEAPEPRLQGPGEALVRPVAVTACDLDVALLRGRAPFSGPFPLGHEFVGEIVELGDAVTGFRRGQRVVVTFQICCGECDRCRTGLTGSCRAAPPGAMYGLRPLGGDWGGAFADLVRVPFAQAMLVPLPAGVAPRTVASASDNLADAWRAVGPPLAASPGADVLIVGSHSSIPLYAVAIARACGAGRVDFIASDPDALGLAGKLGANVRPEPIPRRAGSYPITVDASFDPAGLACALRSLEPEGVCTSTSIYFEDVALPLLSMYTRGVRFITGRVNSRATLPRVLELVETGRLRPEAVTTEVLPWDDAARVLSAPSMKPVFVRD